MRNTIDIMLANLPNNSSDTSAGEKTKDYHGRLIGEHKWEEIMIQLSSLVMWVRCKENHKSQRVVQIIKLGFSG